MSLNANITINMTPALHQQRDAARLLPVLVQQLPLTALTYQTRRVEMLQQNGGGEYHVEGS